MENTMSINELFNTNENLEAAANARSLAGTAQLTNLSTNIANSVIKTVESDFDTYKELVTKSKVDHNAMDQLICTAYDLSAVDITFLTELDETTVENMLKSQQSKRSRSKGKVMTMDNYRAMMTGAIAENLIRLSTGKSKGSSGLNRANGSLEYTVDQLAELTGDQEKLRKEIRNVQSKKSIMKSKEDFNEDDLRWQALLVAEEQLKGLRTETKTVVVDDTKNALTALFDGLDPSTLTDDELRVLLQAAYTLVKEPVVEPEQQLEETVVEPVVEEPAAEPIAEEPVAVEETVEEPTVEVQPEDKGDDEALALVNNKKNRKH